MADIFISYAREDRQRASALADALEGCGYSVWWDRQQVPGQAFDEVIEQQLEACKVVLVCWSDDATASTWVKAEARFALDHEKYVPVLFQTPCKLPFLFAPYHAEDFSDWDGEREALGFKLLRQALSPFVDTAGGDAAELPVIASGKNTQPLSSQAIVAPEMALIRAGNFVMGSDLKQDDMARETETPAREVSIATDFEIGVCPVSFDEYACFTRAANIDLPDDRGWGRENRPVIKVSWQDATDYCKWLSEETGLRFRLPTESEWEYACRAGSITRYWWGDETGKRNANFDGSGSEWSDTQTSPLKSFKPNPFGLYDTSGNVWEWVEDTWHDSYKGAPADESARVAADSGARVLRGGSWFNGAIRARSAARFRNHRNTRRSIIGFRLARTL